MFDGVNKSLPFRKILLTFTSEIFFFWLKDELKGHFTSEVVVLEWMSHESRWVIKVLRSTTYEILVADKNRNPVY